MTNEQGLLVNDATWKDLKTGQNITCFNNNEESWYGTTDDFREYLLVDLQKETTVTGLEICEDNSKGTYIDGFSVMYLNERGHWRNHHIGNHIGEDYHCHFNAIKTRYLQLNITRSQGHPCIKNIAII